MEARVIDREITLVPYFPNEEVALAWYQDADVCKQVDNIDYLYTPERLRRMYDYLSSQGQCYYIQYCGNFVGDVALLNNAEVCIVVSKEYQNLHIGRKCIGNMIELAKEKGMSAIKANIYSFNTQSQRCFYSSGFRQVSDEWFEYRIEQ